MVLWPVSSTWVVSFNYSSYSFALVSPTANSSFRVESYMLKHTSERAAPQCKSQTDMVIVIQQYTTVSERVVLHHTWRIMGHFGDKSFQAITCTGSDKPETNKRKCTKTHKKPQNK